jgi:hypothetical protein
MENETRQSPLGTRVSCVLVCPVTSQGVRQPAQRAKGLVEQVVVADIARGVSEASLRKGEADNAPSGNEDRGIKPEGRKCSGVHNVMQKVDWALDRFRPGSTEEKAPQPIARTPDVKAPAGDSRAQRKCRHVVPDPTIVGEDARDLPIAGIICTLVKGITEQLRVTRKLGRRGIGPPEHRVQSGGDLCKKLGIFK